MRKLKVYGGNTFRRGKQERAVVAAYNQKTAAQVVDASLYYIRGWWHETGNKMEIEEALRTPFRLVFPEEEHDD